MSEIMVSISCNTYNHENYIENAIEGFLKQKMNFKFEILVHDDASEDRTTDIIKTYQKKYPNIIKPIFQTENQYSKGIDPTIYNIERAKGKYIAFCEGDDYWINPYKLQKQVNLLEKNTDFVMCGHNVDVIDTIKNVSIEGEYEKIKNSPEGVINNKDLVSGVPFQTASLLIRMKILQNKELKDFFNRGAFGDYSLCLYVLTKGGIYRFGDKMAVYRTNVTESWTKVNTQSLKAIEKTYSKDKKIIEQFDAMFPGYEKLVSERKLYIDKILKESTIYYEFIESIEKSKLIYKSEVEHTLELNDRVYIFGAGAFGKTILSYLKCEVCGFIDNNVNLINQNINGIPVYPLSEIKKDAKILICSLWGKEIEKQLVTSGYYNYQIVVK